MENPSSPLEGEFSMRRPSGYSMTTVSGEEMKSDVQRSAGCFLLLPKQSKPLLTLRPCSIVYSSQQALPI